MLLLKERYFMNSFFLGAFVFIALISFAEARVLLEINMSHKIIVDNDLQLVNELHVLEDLVMKKQINLKMKNGIKAQIQMQLVQDAAVFGPSAIAMVTGKIMDPKDVVLKDFTEVPLYVPLKESRIVTYKEPKGGQIIEIVVTSSPEQ